MAAEIMFENADKTSALIGPSLSAPSFHCVTAASNPFATAKIALALRFGGPLEIMAKFAAKGMAKGAFNNVAQPPNATPLELPPNHRNVNETAIFSNVAAL